MPASIILRGMSTPPDQALARREFMRIVGIVSVAATAGACGSSKTGAKDQDGGSGSKDSGAQDAGPAGASSDGGGAGTDAGAKPGGDAGGTAGADGGNPDGGSGKPSIPLE